MAAVRQVREFYEIPLDFRAKDFRHELPSRFVCEEPRRERLLEIWRKDFRLAVNAACRSRRSSLINRFTKRAIFQSAMENICLDFSRRTEIVKVSFHQTRNTAKGNPRALLYTLRITRLSKIPESLRHVRQFCVAEIPQRVQEVQAELVGLEGEVELNPVQQGEIHADASSLSTSYAPDDIISAHVEIISEAPHRTVAWSDQESLAYDSPPMTSQVVAVIEDDYNNP